MPAARPPSTSSLHVARWRSDWHNRSTHDTTEPLPTSQTQQTVRTWNIYAATRSGGISKEGRACRHVQDEQVDRQTRLEYQSCLTTSIADKKIAHNFQQLHGDAMLSIDTYGGYWDALNRLIAFSLPCFDTDQLSSVLWIMNLYSTWLLLGNWAFDLNATELDMNTSYCLCFVFIAPVWYARVIELLQLPQSQLLLSTCQLIQGNFFQQKVHTFQPFKCVIRDRTLTFILHRLLLGIEIAENIVLCDLDLIDQSIHSGDLNFLNRWSCQSCLFAILISHDVFYKGKSDTSTSLPSCYHQITNRNFGSFHLLPPQLSTSIRKHEY